MLYEDLSKRRRRREPVAVPLMGHGHWRSSVRSSRRCWLRPRASARHRGSRRTPGPAATTARGAQEAGREQDLPGHGAAACVRQPHAPRQVLSARFLSEALIAGPSPGRDPPGSCQGSSRQGAGRTSDAPVWQLHAWSRVRGHAKVPAGGHEKSPHVASESPHLASVVPVGS